MTAKGEGLSLPGLLVSSLVVLAAGVLCFVDAQAGPAHGPLPMLALGLGALALQAFPAELPGRVLFSSAPALTMIAAWGGGSGAGLACLLCLSGLFVRTLLRRPSDFFPTLQVNLADAAPELLTLALLARGWGWLACLAYVPLALTWPWLLSSSLGRARIGLLVPTLGIAGAAVLGSSLDLDHFAWRVLPLLLVLACVQRLPPGQVPMSRRVRKAVEPGPAPTRERLALEQYRREHDRLEEELQRLQRLLEGTRQMVSTLDLNALGERLQAMLTASIPHNFGAIFTVEHGQLQLRRQWGAELNPPAAMAVCRAVLTHEVPFTFEPNSQLAPLVPYQTSLIAAPMQLEHGTTGVVMVGSTTGTPYEREHRDLLWMIGCLAAISFSNAGLHQEVLSTQAQLVHAGKLAAIGQLAAGVAHELNTPLGAIRLALDGLSRQLKEPPATVERKLERARVAAEQAREIVEKLLVYSRRDVEAERDAVDIATVVRQTVDLVHSQLKQDGVQLEVEYGPGTPVVQGSGPELRQVLTNLLMNARDAVLSPGASAAQVKVQIGCQDGWVFVQVVDHGPGVPAELESRIFEPFFTTKPVGRGTGLGLSISHRIAAQHGGSLEYHPAPGGGALFCLRLPVRKA